jgi:putative Holliday junction resolvase
MRILALDVGDKHIGVALSDELGITARGLDTIQSVSLKRDAAKITVLVDEWSVTTVVIGLPLNLDGTDSIQTTKVREFGKKVENMLKSTARGHIEVVFHDERFTTKIAEKVLIDADVSRAKRADMIDRQAAIVIAQSYLDSIREQELVLR